MRSLDPFDKLLTESLHAAYGEETPTNRPYERLMARLRKETMPRVPAPVLFLAGALLLVFLLMPPDLSPQATALAWLLHEAIGVDDEIQRTERREVQ